MHLINEIETFLGYSQSLQTDEYVCVLTGQFSSGKTKFINYLLGEDLLPVGTREMTAAPTYIHRGERRAEAISKEGLKKKIDISELCCIKKGACEYEKIEVFLENTNIPNNTLFIDTPGVNSTNIECDERWFQGVDIIFYFLAKSISATDVKTIETLCDLGNSKIIFVRTRIDEIKKSEENIVDAYNEEKLVLQSMYPEASLYFVSLTEEAAELNQLSDLLYYIENDLEQDLCKRRSKRKNEYIINVLRPAIEQMKNEILLSFDSASYSKGLFSKSKKQLKTIEKNIKANEDIIRKQILTAQRNYVSNGYAFLEKCIGRQGSVSCHEIQSFIISCMRKQEDWYSLELEDVASGISICQNNKNQRLITDGSLRQVFSKYEKARCRFLSYSFFSSEDQDDCDEFSDLQEAKEYFERMMNSIFINIDANFSEMYESQVEEMLDALEVQYRKEDELIQKYIMPDFDAVTTIDNYLLELDAYGEK